jgi:uncharacterized lipoprotein YmbA
MKRTAEPDLFRRRAATVRSPVRPVPACIALAAALLAGCASSPPTQFYSLAAVPASSAAASQPSPGTAHGAPIRVAAVHIPPTLDRREIVRTGAGDRIDVSGLHRWGAPFDEMVQHVLTQDLIERLAPGKVVLPEGPSPSGTDAIVVDLLQFQSDTGGGVVLQGSWSLLTSGGQGPALIRNFKYDTSASPAGYDGESSAMSRLLGRLADDIAREVRMRH